MFGEELTARAAGKGAAGAGYGNCFEVVEAIGNGLEESDAFGAAAKAVAGAFDVGSGNDFAFGGAEGCADLEAAVGGVGARACVEGGLNEA